MKNYWVVIWCLCTSSYLYAQPGLSDSLRHILRNSPHDSNKARQLSAAIWLFPYNQPDSAIYYADSVIRLSRKTDYAYGEAIAYIHKAQSYVTIGDYSKAMFYCYQGLRIHELIGDWNGRIYTYGTLAGIYYELGETRKALDYRQKEREVLFSLRDSAYSRWSEQVEAISDYRATNDYETAKIYLKMGKTDSALKYGTRALSYFQNYWSAVPVLMGDIYSARGDYGSALKYYSIITEIKNPIDSAKNFVGRATVFKQVDKTDSSRLFALQALEISRRIKYAKGVLQASEILSLLYEKNDPQESLKYLKISKEISDSLYNKERINQVNSIAFNDELRKLDVIAAEKAARNRFMTWSLFGGLFTFFIAGILLWRNNRHKKRANTLLQKEKQKVEQALEELKITQAQLIQSEKMASLGELTAGIAHEIQNPLNFVNNFSEVNDELLKELKTEAEKGNLEEIKVIANDIAFNSEKINHHGKRADAIVKGMLQHSRASNGQKEPTDINALADEYLRLAYHGLRAKDKSFNATMQTDFDESIGKINIIPQEIGRVVFNLINNAFYAVDEKKKQQPNFEPIVTVATRSVKPPSGGLGAKVEIKVKDNGNGIPQKVLDKIFQPFFTTKPTGQGTGLGLSLSYDIAKAHGGELKVKTKEGEGSEFTIQIPVSKTPES